MAKQVQHTAGEWRYSINYGPDGEQNYANVYDATGELVGNLRTYQATSIVRAMNANAAMLEALKAMAKEFRAYDLPYGSAAYLQATNAIAKAEGRS